MVCNGMVWLQEGSAALHIDASEQEVMGAGLRSKGSSTPRAEEMLSSSEGNRISQPWCQ